jgi:hypothetical protein
MGNERAAARSGRTYFQPESRLSRLNLSNETAGQRMVSKISLGVRQFKTGETLKQRRLVGTHVPFLNRLLRSCLGQHFIDHYEGITRGALESTIGGVESKFRAGVVPVYSVGGTSMC